MIPWYVYALMAAVLGSISEIISKKALFKMHAMEFRTTFSILRIPLLLMLIPFIDFNLDAWLYLYIFLIAFIAVIAGLFWTKAVRHSEISSVAPLKNISPFFLVILSYFLLHETISLRQGIGIIILLVGGYILEADHKISNLKEPLLKIIKTKTLHFVFFSFLLYSLCSIGDKYILGFTDRFTYLFLVYLFIAILNYTFSMIFHKGYKDVVYCVKKSGWMIFLIGIFGFISALAYLKALTMAMVVLVIPIKRLSTLFTTIIGGELFHDHGLKMKIIACIILIFGSVLVVI